MCLSHKADVQIILFKSCIKLPGSQHSLDGSILSHAWFHKEPNCREISSEVPGLRSSATFKVNMSPRNIGYLLGFLAA